MQLVFALLFWGSCFLLAYSWVLFPLGLFLLAANKKEEDPEIGDADPPFVSVIVACYNEAGSIKKKLENLLSLDYSPAKVEFIIASDGSTDGTVEIARRFASPNVKIISFGVNRGKASVHNDVATNVAKGEVLVFTDAETLMEPDFLREGVKWFHDPSYGCGAGNYFFSSADSIGESETLYWKWEKQIRYWEHKLGCLPFASGGCFFIRRDLFEQIPPYSDIDNLLTLATVEKGYKLFYAKSAKAFDRSVMGKEEFFRKRVRTALRSFSDMMLFLPRLVKAKKYLILFVLFSHRILRWVSGWLMAVLLFANVFLVVFDSTMLYRGFLGGQILFYMLAGVGYLCEKKQWQAKLSKLPNVLYAFVLANLCSAIACLKMVRGERIYSWKNR